MNTIQTDRNGINAFVASSDYSTKVYTLNTKTPSKVVTKEKPHHQTQPPTALPIMALQALSVDPMGMANRRLARTQEHKNQLLNDPYLSSFVGKSSLLVHSSAPSSPNTEEDSFNYADMTDGAMDRFVKDQRIDQSEDNGYNILRRIREHESNQEYLDSIAEVARSGNLQNSAEAVDASGSMNVTSVFMTPEMPDMQYFRSLHIC